MTVWKNHFVTLPKLVACCLSFAVFGVVGLPADSNAQDSWGNFKGRIIVDGAIPEAEALTLSTKDERYCRDTGETFTDRSLKIGEGGGLQNAYVMMYFGRSDRKRPAVHPSYEKPEKVTLDNSNCRFEPHAIFLRTGQTLELTNSDRIGHNCHVVTMRNEENVSLGAGQTAELTFEEVDRVPGEVKCDAHPWMKAVIVVRDVPYVAITDDKGNFEIKNIPAGEWSFQFWHKRSGYMKTLTQDGKTFLGRRGEIKVTIPSGDTLDMGELIIPVDDLPKE